MTCSSFLQRFCFGDMASLGETPKKRQVLKLSSNIFLSLVRFAWSVFQLSDVYLIYVDRNPRGSEVDVSGRVSAACRWRGRSSFVFIKRKRRNQRTTVRPGTKSQTSECVFDSDWIVWPHITHDLTAICTRVLPSVLWHCWLGVRKSIRPVKNWVMRWWHGYLSKARCRWLAYGPVDATATPSSLASLKSRIVLPSGASLPRLSWKRGRCLGECRLANCCIDREEWTPLH